MPLPGLQPLAGLLPPVFHPLFVHFTVALFPLAGIFAALAAARRYPWARQATLVVLTLAVIGTGFTVLTGWLEFEDKEDALEGTEAGAAGERHELLGFVTGGTFTVLWGLLVWQRATLLASRFRWAYVAALWAAIILLVVTAWIGGRLVYEFGVNTPATPASPSG